MSVPSKDIIDKWIIPHLKVGSRGPKIKVPLTEIVELIFHRLKTGCQWRELPTKQFFDGTLLTWNSFSISTSGQNQAVG
jgi:transposase